MKKEDKTNVMRILESEGVNYIPHEYDVSDGLIDGISIAEKLNQPKERVFKTLITQGASKEYFVFCLPVDCELDLKKAAKAVGEKSVEMIPVADINKVSGYVRGGCSPLGLKRKMEITFEEAIVLYDTVMLSAGKIGRQIEISPDDIIRLTGGKTADLIKN
ncbi:MAG: Cys-tRNA(Pro) deacylase [Ruminococcaceae bacterium]|nr:Cys-tRNA(Pro) deacylase [Oscillospiraceae bacterium]